MHQSVRKIHLNYGKINYLSCSQEPLVKQAALMSNLLRKVFGIDFRLPSVENDYKNKYPKLWTVEDAYFFVIMIVYDIIA